MVQGVKIERGHPRRHGWRRARVIQRVCVSTPSGRRPCVRRGRNCGAARQACAALAGKRQQLAKLSGRDGQTLAESLEARSACRRRSHRLATSVRGNQDGAHASTRLFILMSRVPHSDSWLKRTRRRSTAVAGCGTPRRRRRLRGAGLPARLWCCASRILPTHSSPCAAPVWKSPRWP